MRIDETAFASLIMTDAQAVAEMVAHEGDHARVFLDRGANSRNRAERMSDEISASRTQSAVAQGQGQRSRWGVYIPGDPAATEAGIQANATRSVDQACGPPSAPNGRC